MDTSSSVLITDLRRPVGRYPFLPESHPFYCTGTTYPRCDPVTPHQAILNPRSAVCGPPPFFSGPRLQSLDPRPHARGPRSAVGDPQWPSGQLLRGLVKWSAALAPKT